MARRPLPLPGAFAHRSFTAAEAREAEVSPRQLRRPSLRAPHHGVRSLVEVPASPEDLNVRAARAAAEYLPLLRRDRGEVFSHTTALLLWGAPIRCAATMHLAIPHPHAPARGKQVVGHRSCRPGAPRDVTLQNGIRLPCAGPVEALLQSASQLGFLELVVAADHLIRVRGPALGRYSLTTLDELVAAAEATAASGMLRLRAALQVARVGAESRMESLQHFELARMGLDALELQANLHDDDGRWIGRFDAVDRKKRRILEYDGEQHRTDRAQYLRDEERLERARKAGYRVMRTHKEDFQPRSIARTRREICVFLDERPRPVPRVLARYFAESDGL